MHFINDGFYHTLAFHSVVGLGKDSEHDALSESHLIS